MERLQFIKEGRYFNCKEKRHKMLNCPAKAKVSVIIDIANVDNIKNIKQKKKYFLPKTKKKSFIISSSFMLKNLCYKSLFTI